MIVVSAGLVFGLVAVVAAVILAIRFSRYSQTLRHQFPDVWQEFQHQDEMVAAFGKWIRWPVGSAFVLAHFFTPDAGTADLKVLKRGSRLIAGTTIVAFVLSLLLFAMGPASN